MNTTKLLRLETASQALIVTVQEDVGALAEERLQMELEEALALFDGGDYRDVVVDLGRADYFGSILLGAMNALWQRTRSRDGSLVLCQVSSLGREILTVAQLDRVWPIHDTRSSALERLASQ